MPKSRDSSVQVAVIVAGLLAVVGGAWLFLNSGTDDVIETTQLAAAAKSADEVTGVGSREEKMPVDTALQMAELAFQSGHLAGDEEGTALDFYRQVLRQEPDNVRAKAGMQLIAIQLVDEADDMMAKGEFEQVVKRLKALNKIEAGSDSVVALQQQLVEKSAGMFTAMDRAISRGQLDKAEGLARSLRVIPDADPGRISAALVTIAQIRKGSKSAAIAAAQAPVKPVQKPQDIPATKSVTVVENGHLEGAADVLTTPDTVVAEAAPESVDTAVLSTNLLEESTYQTVEVIDPAEQVRAQIESLLASATASLEQNRLINPADENALELFNQVLALESTNAEAKRGLRGIVQKLTSSAYDMADAGDIEGARAELDSADSVGIAEALVTQARKDVRAKWLEIESAKVFSVRGFEVEKSVSPKYPTRAMTRSIEGWVKVEFTVGENGQTRDLEVVESSRRLAKQFSKSAISAVKQWRFKPRVLDGEVIAQRSETMVQFKLAD